MGRTNKRTSLKMQKCSRSSTILDMSRRWPSAAVSSSRMIMRSLPKRLNRSCVSLGVFPRAILSTMYVLPSTTTRLLPALLLLLLESGFITWRVVSVRYQFCFRRVDLGMALLLLRSMRRCSSLFSFRRFATAESTSAAVQFMTYTFITPSMA